MPAIAHILPEHELLVSKFEGNVSGDLFLEYYKTLLSFADNSKEFSELVDFRNVNAIEVENATLAVIANTVEAAYKSSKTQLKCAVVAPSDLAYGLSRMYQMDKSPQHIELKVFRDICEALAWLV